MKIKKAIKNLEGVMEYLVSLDCSTIREQQELSVVTGDIHAVITALSDKLDKLSALISL
jgi:copper chaperone CopZ